MELKPYQRKVIQDLQDYLSYLALQPNPADAYRCYWQEKIGPYNPETGEGMPPYQNAFASTLAETKALKALKPQAVGQIQRMAARHVPHLCLKVPTAGGKTFIGCHALASIFAADGSKLPQAVLWLVPWGNLLEQTLNHFRNPDHPYRQKLSSLFHHRVTVYTKEDLLSGQNFNPSTVQEQLSLIVMSIASLRTNNKEGRKVYQENGQLASFVGAFGPSQDNGPPAKNLGNFGDLGNLENLQDTDETALINVIRNLRPVLLVDESHNTESQLSIAMRAELNPSFMLDLSATPRQSSNIISYVPAIELKKEQMVKLPVVVYKQYSKNEVIANAIHLRQRLETLARKEASQPGYIRPIVLFQAETKSRAESPSDRIGFAQIKAKLVKAGIPADQIKIKTANHNELKGIDLLHRDCPVRYIITINALKEGWDCPFAYILASLADRSAVVDVEQILGRVLRQPYVRQHRQAMLNYSYVLTASVKFQDTLGKIVKALQACGFSEKDYRSGDSESTAQKWEQEGTELFGPNDYRGYKEEQADEQTDEIDSEQIYIIPEEKTDEIAENSVMMQFEQQATEIAQEQEREMRLAEQQTIEQRQYEELGDRVKSYAMRQRYREQARATSLPQFVLHRPHSPSQLFSASEILLNHLDLLNGFQLSKQDSNVDLQQIDSEIFKIDVAEDSAPCFSRIQNRYDLEVLRQHIQTMSPESRIQEAADRLLRQLGKMQSFVDEDLTAYLERIVRDFDYERLLHLLEHTPAYARRIKDKIRQLSDIYAEQQFDEMVQTGEILTKPQWAFAQKIQPGPTGIAIEKSLYEREGSMNPFESEVILDISSLPNIAFWHRNLGRTKGFALNGYKTNHYPDFILATTSGKLILLETKGDDRDNPDSSAKRKLGKTWAQRSGPEYSYFMVYDKISPAGAYNRTKAKELIARM